MKVLRILGSICCCIMLCAGFALVMAKDVMGNMIQSQIVDLSTDVIVNQVLNTNLSSYVEIPKAQQAKVQEIQKEIAQDEKVNELSQEVMSAVLDENKELNHLDQRVEDLLKTYGPQIVEASGVDIPQEQVNQVIEEKMASVDVQEIFQEKVDQIHEQVPASMTTTMNVLTNTQNATLAYIGYGIMIGAVIGMILLTFSPWRWLGYVGATGLIMGGGIMVITKFIPLLLPSSIIKNNTMVEDIFDQICNRIFQYGMWSFIVAVICIIMYYMVRAFSTHTKQA